VGADGTKPAVQTTQEGIQIFSLAVLLSSLFVYNQMGGIDEAAIDRLSLITELTRHIRVRSAKHTGVARPCPLTWGDTGRHMVVRGCRHMYMHTLLCTRAVTGYLLLSRHSSLRCISLHLRSSMLLIAWLQM
jgi:hypothetical protein